MMLSVRHDVAAIIECQLPTLLTDHDTRHGKNLSWLAINSKYEIPGTQVPHLGPAQRRRNHAPSVESFPATCRPIN